MAEDRPDDREAEVVEWLGLEPLSGVKLLDSYFREAISRYIASRCRYFDGDDIGDVYIKTLNDFIACTKKPNFDPNEPLKLVFHIARLRSLDKRREKKAGRQPKLDDLLDTIAQDLKDTRTRYDWLELKASWPELRKVLDKMIDELPERQRHAMNAFVETYWDIRTQGSKQRLAEQIRQQYGYDCTASQAADNVDAAIETLAPKLQRAGFNLLRRD